VKDQPAIDLILGLLRVEVFHLREQPLNFMLEVARQVILGKDGRRRIGHGNDGNQVEIAAARMQLPAASPACQSRRIGIIGPWRGSHGSGPTNLTAGFQDTPEPFA